MPITEAKGKELVKVGNVFWYKNNESDQIWWIDDPNTVGEWLFSFDQKKIYNMFSDYPYKLTAEQKKIFDEENPYWKDFFSDRQ